MNTPNVYTTTSAPTVNDDVNAGFLCGDIWIDKSDATPANWVAYMMLSCAEGAAVWKQITA